MFALKRFLVTNDKENRVFWQKKFPEWRVVVGPLSAFKSPASQFCERKIILQTIFSALSYGKM